METQRQIRAAISQLIWGRLQQCPDPERQSVLAALGPTTASAITQPLGIGWVEMSPHMDLCGAIAQVMGEARHTRMWHDIIKEFGGSRLLRGFFSIASRAGTDGLMRRVDLAYSSQTRGLGSVGTSEVREGSATVELDGFPAKEYSLPLYAGGLRGTLSATVEVSGAKLLGVEIADLSEPRGSCRFLVRWL